MGNIRKLKSEEEFASFVDIVVNAYPGTSEPTASSKEQLVQAFLKKQEEDSAVDFVGLFRNGTLIGGMRLHTYEMNLYSKWVKVGGVGLVAVDLLHKKEKAAKEMIEYFIQENLKQGICFTALYPFNPGFYHKMGYGYGPKMVQYTIEPGSFPKSPEKGTLVFLKEEDKDRLNECYERVAVNTHGMFKKTAGELSALFKQPHLRIVGIEENGVIRGYSVFSFRKDPNGNFLLNDLVIRELVYETPEVLKKLCNFIHSQADQVNRVEWNTQDDSLHFLLHDSRNGTNRLIPSVYHADALTGVGLMYRISNVKQFISTLQHRNFNGKTITFKLHIEDSFVPSNNQEMVIDCKNGQIVAKNDGSYEVEMRIDIAHFSSLFMGVIPFSQLYKFGLVKLSNPTYAGELDRFFYTPDKPICTTAF